jgi:general secretion pathway protein G
MCSRFQHPRRRAAFTLVELMVVIVLIGLLAGAVAVGTRQYIISGKRAVAKLEISRICQALDTFYTAYDRFPTNDEGIEVLAQPGDKFAAALLSEVPKDPWGRPYEYIHPGRETAYEVLSFGADGREGGTGADGDISSTSLDENDQKT